MRLAVGMALCLCLFGCGDNKTNGSTGPGIDVHCAGLAPVGNGDTSVHVTCPDPAV